jgi:hypothetical protein
MLQTHFHSLAFGGRRARARQATRAFRAASEYDGDTVSTGAIGINGPTPETAAGRAIRGYRTGRGPDLNAEREEVG